MIFHRIVMALGLGMAMTLATALTHPLAAQEDRPAFLSIGAGYYDVNKRDDGAADFRLEYRHGQGLWKIKPWAGIEATSDGAVYGLGGILLDLELGERFAIVPSFGVGAYSNGSGKDLGGTLEFRSQIELAYIFGDRSRLSLAFSHISNADTGHDNPGAEILNLYYSLPLNRILGE